MVFHLFKHHDTTIHTHEIIKDEETPITALHITLSGTHERITTTYNKKNQPTPFGSFNYHIPHCLDASTSTRPLRKSTFEFSKQDTSMGASGSQQAFLGVYCIWYREIEKPKTAREYEGADGDFWILRQLQWRPERGETVENEDVPMGMEVGMEEEWWFRGCVRPKMGYVIRGGGTLEEEGAAGSARI